jgi:hypothetical protein
VQADRTAQALPCGGATDESTKNPASDLPEQVFFIRLLRSSVLRSENDVRRHIPLCTRNRIEQRGVVAFGNVTIVMPDHDAAERSFHVYI